MKTLKFYKEWTKNELIARELLILNGNSPRGLATRPFVFGYGPTALERRVREQKSDISRILQLLLILVDSCKINQYL